MTHSVAVEHDVHITHSEVENRTVFGFWIYLMTDCVLFGVLFATYAVLHKSTAGGPTSQELFNLPYVLAETLLLLISSFTCGIATVAASNLDKKRMAIWFGITFLFGLAFIAMELYEFAGLVREGHSWTRSAFLSAFFTLVGTHGAHISVGLLWMLVLIPQILYKGFNPYNFKRVLCLSLFWHFLDVVWIFIYTIVFLMGVL